MNHPHPLSGFQLRMGIALAVLTALGSGASSVHAQEAAATRNGRSGFTPSFNELPTGTTNGTSTPVGSTPSGQSAPPPKSGQEPATGTPTTTPPTNSGFNNTATQVLSPPVTAQRSTSLNDQGLQNTAQPSPAASPTTTPSPVPQEITKVSQTFSSLPNDGGQVWREYDIRPYTMEIADSEKPERAIIDWILKQTGTEMWFNQPMGILSATRDKVMVYHTPEIHNSIKPLIDRFNYSRAQKLNAQVHLITVGNPNWREMAYQYLQPVDVHSPQVEAWLISRENAALLLNQLARRNDYRSHASGTMTISNGQKMVLKKERPVQFLRSLRWTPGQPSPVQPILAQINGGYSLSLSLLNSLDGQSIEASITCSVDQVEKLTNVKIPINPQSQPRNFLNRATNNGDLVTLQIPQFVSWRLNERVRWPADQVLVVSCGVVATPDSDAARTGPASGLTQLLNINSSRADALLFIDYRGPGTGPSNGPQTAQGQPDHLRAITPK